MKTNNLSEDYLREVGHRFKIIRTFLRFDQMKMSQIMKIGQSQMSKIEVGSPAPTIYQLIRLKKYPRKMIIYERI